MQVQQVGILHLPLRPYHSSHGRNEWILNAEAAALLASFRVRLLSIGYHDIIKYILAVCRPMREQLREKIAGEITLSADAGKTIRKWREEFNISQQELAKHLGFSPSVVSDYESGRRKSPGITIVRRIVDGLIGLDERTGGEVLKRYDLGEKHDCVISIDEFRTSVTAQDFVEMMEGENITPRVPLDRHIHGYTIIDSIKAITALNSFDYLKIYGWSSERALIFTGVKFGRSPMIAIRAHPLKPSMVCYHRPEHVDDLAIKLATLENIPLVKITMPIGAIVEKLKKLT